MLTFIYRIFSLNVFIACALVACGDDSESLPTSEADASAGSAANSGKPPQSDVAGSPAADMFGGCERGVIESDFQAAPLSGSGITDGKLPAGDYLLSTTYLTLREGGEAQMRFGELMGPIKADLATRDGLVAFSLGASRSCGTARTLAVWRDDVAMLGFVTGPAHAAAVTSIKDVSRGGSIVTHWQGDQETASWTSAAQHVAADDGPLY